VIPREWMDGWKEAPGIALRLVINYSSHTHAYLSRLSFFADLDLLGPYPRSRKINKCENEEIQAAYVERSYPALIG
jgi:hypothetical protein